MSELLTEPISKSQLKPLPEDRKSVNYRKAQILDLKAKGLSVEQIAELTGYTRNSVNVIYCNLMKNKDSFALMRPSALKTIKHFIKGKPVGVVMPSGSDVTKSVAMVLDRTDPIIQHVQNEIQVTVNRGCDTQSVDNQGSISVDKSIIDITP